MSSDSPSLESIFASAIQKSSKEKMLNYVDSIPGASEEVRTQARQLIEAHCKSAKSFLEAPATGVNSKLEQLAQTMDVQPQSMEAGLTAAFSEDAAVVVGGTGHSVLKSLSQQAGKSLNVTLREDSKGHSGQHTQHSTDIPNSDADSRYQLHGEIARGGMGAVLKGRDVDLGRDLAVKVLLDKHRDKPELLERFVEEAQIGGQLQHPGIVPVYELGQFEDQRPFFTMKLVKGETLAAILGRRKSPEDDLPKLLGIFEQICQTMAYAHSKGVIHRDLKPANIMVGAFGEVQVMDWGLSKVLDTGGENEAEKIPQVDVSVIQTKRSEGSSSGGSGSNTIGGSIMGTPAYMPPEQAHGRIKRLDTSSDVFALGSVLAEILSGKPCYVADDFEELVYLAKTVKLEDCFKRLDVSNAAAELLQICKKALAEKQEERHTDASELAGEVTEYLEGVQERLKATELAKVEAETRTEEEKKRKRLFMGLTGVICGALLITSSLAVLLKNSSDVATAAKANAEASADAAKVESKKAREAEEEARDAEAAAKVATQREASERLRLQLLRMADNSRQLRESARSRSILLAAEAIRIAKENDLWPMPEVHSALLEATIDVSGKPLPDGKLWFMRSKNRALTNRDDKLAVWEAGGKELKPTGFEHQLEPGWNDIRFNDDGTRIAIRNQHVPGTLLLTLDETGSTQVANKRLPGYLKALSSDASMIVTNLDGQLLLWREPFANSDKDSSEDLGEYVLHSNLEISRDNRWFFQHTGAMVQLWDLELGQEYRIPVENNVGKAIGFSPDGTWLYLGGEEGKHDRIFDLTAADPINSPQPLFGSASVVKDYGHFFFSEDGSWLAVGASISEIQLYRIDGRKASIRCVLKGAQEFNAVHGDLFSPDSQFLATIEGPNVRLWDLANIDRVEMGRAVLSAEDRIVPLWEAKQFGEIHSRLFVCANDELPQTVNFSSDCRWMCVWTFANESRVWDLNAPLLSQTQLETRSKPYSLKFSSTNEHLAVGDVDGSAKVYDLKDGLPYGEPTKLDSDHQGAVVVDFSLDGRFLMTRPAYVDASLIKIWNTRDLSSPRYTLSGITRPIWKASISRNGRFVIADLEGQGTADTEFYCWDLQSGREDTPQVLNAHTAPLWMLEFGEHEEELFSGGEDGALLRWDLSQGEPKATTILETNEVVWAIRKTEDGWRVASNSVGQGHLWDLDEDFGSRGSSVYRNTRRTPSTLRLSPDGQCYSAGNSVWNLATHECLAAHAHKQGNTFASNFSRDGRYFATMCGAWPSSIIVSDLSADKTMRIAGKNGRARQWALDFSPDGRWLATAFHITETKICLFALDENAALQRAKQLVGRELTDSERIEFGVPTSVNVAPNDQDED